MSIISKKCDRLSFADGKPNIGDCDSPAPPIELTFTKIRLINEINKFLTKILRLWQKHQARHVQVVNQTREVCQDLRGGVASNAPYEFKGLVKDNQATAENGYDTYKFANRDVEHLLGRDAPAFDRDRTTEVYGVEVEVAHTFADTGNGVMSVTVRKGESYRDFESQYRTAETSASYDHTTSEAAWKDVRKKAQQYLKGMRFG